MRYVHWEPWLLHISCTRLTPPTNPFPPIPSFPPSVQAVTKSKAEYLTWFLKPVDLKAVPDYTTIVKNPMDLGTIDNKLKRKLYK